MFSLKEFIKTGLLEAIGHMSEYKIRLNALGWLEKGVFDEADLADIQAAIDARYTKKTKKVSENTDE